LWRPFEDCGCRIVLHPRPERNFDPACVARTWRFLREVSCDIFHCHNVHTSPLIGAALARVPVRIWSKLAMSPCYEKGLAPGGVHRLVPSVRLSCALAHRVLAISRAVRDELIDLGVPSSRIEVFRVPADLGLYKRARNPLFRRALGVDDSKLLITAVGRAAPVKGWDILLEAFALVAQSFGHVRLALVGDANDSANGCVAEHLRRQVLQLGLADKVFFLGRRDDIPDILASTDVFVLPSRSEGQSCALVEALAAGLPCVAARVGGVPEILKDGFNGLLFDREDVRGLAEQLELLVRRRDLRESLASRARRSVISFDLPQATQRLVNLYVALLTRRVAHASGTLHGAGVVRR